MDYFVGWISTKHLMNFTKYSLMQHQNLGLKVWSLESRPIKNLGNFIGNPYFSFGILMNEMSILFTFDFSECRYLLLYYICYIQIIQNRNYVRQNYTDVPGRIHTPLLYAFSISHIHTALIHQTGTYAS